MLGTPDLGEMWSVFDNVRLNVFNLFWDLTTIWYCHSMLRKNASEKNMAIAKFFQKKLVRAW